MTDDGLDRFGANQNHVVASIAKAGAVGRLAEVCILITLCMQLLHPS